MQTIPVILSNKVEVCKDTFELSFTLKENLDTPINPGQYIWLILPSLAYPDQRGNRRAFSLSSISPDFLTISILFRRGVSGFKQTLLELPLGSELQITKPIGTSFVLNDFTDKHVVIIAGGVGISPFLSLLRSNREPRALSKQLIFINTSQDREFLVSEIEAKCLSKNISFTKQYGSFLQSFLPAIDLLNTVYYICGSKTLVQTVHDVLVKSGVQLQNMYFEQYYPQTNTKMTMYFEQYHAATNGIDETFFSSQSQSNPFKMLVDSTSSHLIVTDEN